MKPASSPSSRPLVNFSAISSQIRGTWLGSAAKAALSLVPSEMAVPVLQGPLRGKKWIAGSCVHSCWLGSYEIAESRQMATLVHPQSVFFDIGAQAGYHTLIASDLVGPAGQVFAFEPAPRNVSHIRRHLALNHISNVSVVESAVADRDGTMCFDEGSSLVSGHLSDTGPLSVRVLSLDCEIIRGNLPEPDFIKIDVEGAELKVLQGAVELLLRRHPTLFIETHQWLPRCESSRRDCLRFLSEMDYQVLNIDVPALSSDYHLVAIPAAGAPVQ
jgi:FkbM family methyltransferase